MVKKKRSLLVPTASLEIEVVCKSVLASESCQTAPFIFDLAAEHKKVKSASVKSVDRSERQLG